VVVGGGGRGYGVCTAVPTATLCVSRSETLELLLRDAVNALLLVRCSCTTRFYCAAELAGSGADWLPWSNPAQD